MDTAGSVSKGCFAFKGKKKVAKLENYLSDDEFGQSVVKRHQVGQDMWTEIDTQIQILQEELNSRIFDDLLTFAADSCSTFTLDNLETSKTMVYREIPTAALVTGVNTPDHGVMFATLVSLLKERVSPLVAILKSKDCQNVKNTISKTLSQMVDNPQLLHDEDEKEEELTQKNLPLTLSTLAQWYKHKFKSKLSPKKRRSKGDDLKHKYPPAIVVLQDFESFLPHVIQDFITIASSYLHQLPIVFVFGIATTISAVHSLLPNAVSSLLCMEKFMAPPSSEYLTMLINQIVMTPEYPFKIGARVFQLLLDIFLYHDFSVLNFVKGFRFSLLDHYLNMPLSHLCCPLKEIHKKVKVMDAEEVETIRQLPSFMRFVEENPASNQPKLLLDEKFAKEAIVDLLEKMHTYHMTLFPVLQCLHKLVCKLPKHPLGKQQREVYSLVLESNIFETDAYKQSMELLRMLAKDELEEMLKQSIDVLMEKDRKAITYLPTDLSLFMDRFNTLDDLIGEEEDKGAEDESSLKVIPKQKNMYELRQTLKEMKKKKKKLSPYEKLRSEIIDYFDSVFRKYLICPKNLPLHEIFYYDAIGTVKKYLNASPRSATQLALSNPQYHLQSINCDEEENLSSAMPDICIVYKLHLECGMFINLYDWLQAFITVISSDAEFDPKNPDQVLQARFIRAVSELQFLGFIMPTKRKTDHVVRLTWGNC
ncbi:hypothetical protein ACJMK2_028742 [Sinanodonta woodiana]|uniref:Origin recognition complex subunit 3 n=1 Tax=Sinanodonta woodiana TaxID=1069815 RepID=A0ABD3XBL9_SINWO